MFRRRLPLTTMVDGITVIITGAITIDITMAAITTGTEGGLLPSMDAPGIIATTEP